VLRELNQAVPHAVPRTCASCACDGLTGLPTAISAVWQHAAVHLAMIGLQMGRDSMPRQHLQHVVLLPQVRATGWSPAA